MSLSNFNKFHILDYGFLAIVVSAFFLQLFVLRGALAKLSFTHPQIEHLVLSKENMHVQHKAAYSDRIIWGLRPNEYTDRGLRDVLDTLHPVGILIHGIYTKETLTNEVTRIRKNSPKKILIAIDQEGGSVRHLMDDPNPGAYVLQSLPENAQCEVIRSTNLKITEAGIDINFGLIADTSSHPTDIMKGRSYDSNPSTVSSYVARYLSCTTSTSITAKHFPGLGGTNIDSHRAQPINLSTLSEWATTTAIPFKKAIEREVPYIMMGHAIYTSVDSLPASLSKKWITAIRSTGYKGQIITDDLGMISQDPYTVARLTEEALLAGNDLVLISSLPGYDVHTTYTYIASRSAERK